MARTGRPGLSQEQKAELWRRWKAGETLSDIGRALGKHAASVFGVVAAKGGFAPVPRSRKSGSLSLIEREEISRGLVSGRSFRQLGRDLGRAVPTISREVARNGGHRAYRAARAEERALDRARRPKPCQLAFNPALCKLVAGKLSGQWSPQQIAGWLKARDPGDPFMTYRMRRSIKACSFRHVAFLRRSCSPICAAAGSCAGAGQRQLRGRRGARS
jgi:DNA-binding CsgD family transcriptional regulator